MIVTPLVLGAVPAAAADFPSTVRAILDSRTDGPLAEMPPERRAMMTDCVINTLAGLPKGRKNYILEGATFDEQVDRFGRVVDENRAEWRQNIAGACAHIALDSGGDSFAMDDD
jgi:hypothetical protein